jgi:predicted ATP-dependent endonuclease of OLD family
MKLTHIKIEGLYKSFNIETNLDPRLNILVGNNGSYKTTVLKTLSDSISKDGHSPEYNFNHLFLDFDDGSRLTYSKRYRMGKPYGFVSEGVSDNPSESGLVEIMNADAVKNGKSLPVMSVISRINVDSIFTYDTRDKELVSGYSELETVLKGKISDYGIYLADLTDSISEDLKAGKTNAYTKAFAARDSFKEILDSAFSETHKTLSNINRMDFVKAENRVEIPISWKNLSSGEKQLVIILLTVLMERGNDSILIMDEPEISMHITWQSQLLDWIFKLNPNVQVIMSTHSPSIFGKGWGNKIIYMEDIITNAINK